MKIKKNNNSWLIIILSSFVVSVILWNTYVFVQNFKKEERNKMELWSLATLELIDVEGEISNLTLEVLKKNKTTPMIKVDNNGEIYRSPNTYENQSIASSKIWDLNLYFYEKNKDNDTES